MLRKSRHTYLLLLVLLMAVSLTGTLLAQDDAPVDDPAPIVPVAPVAAPSTQVSGLQTIGRTLDIINLRSGAGTTFPILNTLPINSGVVVEARNSFGNWVIVHTTLPTGVIRGWAAARYVSWADTIEVTQFSPSAEIIVPGVPPAPPAGGAPVTDGAAAPAVTAPIVPVEGAPVVPVVPALPDTSVAAPPAAAPVALPPLPVDTTIGRTQDILNVRSGAGTRFPVLAEIEYNAPVLVEGQNSDGRWFLIRSQNNLLRGWVASRYVSVSALVDTDRLPVFDGTVSVTQLGGASAAPAVPVASADGVPATDGVVAPVAPVSAPVVASSDLAAIQNELAQLPVLPVISEQTRFVYQRGLASGANPRHLIKVGVNVVNNNNYLSPIGQGNINYGAFQWMEYAVGFFQQGEYNSWTEPPVIAGLTGGLLDPGAVPANCPAGNFTPIDCAAASRGAAFAIVYTGAVESVSDVTPAQFSAGLNGVVSALVNRGTVPILTTLPIRDGLDRTTLLQYNKVIIDTAAQYGVPVFNFYRIALDMPQNGLDGSGVALTSSGIAPNFGTEKDIFGYDALNFYTIWALSTVLGGL
ncbi:MAG: SH3 domain-containing protein [Aggregatilineales bacterium]